jgi:hypothetical protein
MSSSDSRRERRLAAKNGGREGGETAATSLHAWVRRELSLRVSGQGPGWVGKKVAPVWDEPEGGCRGCGTIGKPCALTMLTRLRPAEKVVLFTLAHLCDGCAGDAGAVRAVADRAFGPADPASAPPDEGPPPETAQ